MEIAKYIALVFCAIAMLTSCSENANKSALNTALNTADSILVQVEAIPTDSVNSVRIRLATAKEEVRWLGSEENVDFVREDAPVINELAKASRYLKDAPSRILGLKNESSRCRNQITGLIAVIDSNATIDSKGDTITDAYIAENTLREIEAVEELVEAYIETERLIGLGFRTDSAAWPSIDSLLLAKKSDWAKGVAGIESETEE
jgi:hypothetical protein